MSEPLPIPQGPLWTYNRNNPVAIQAAFEFLNKVKRDEYVLVSAISALNGSIKPIESDQGRTIPLPLKFSTTLQNTPTYTGTAGAGYVQATIQALMDQVTALTNKQNALLAQLRLTGQNPS